MTKKSLTIFLGIFILGSVLRFYRLGNVPVGFHRDEAFLGYNAYSILQTGKDMSGSFLPLHFQSFIYSPSGYAYLSIPFIKLFGLSVFSVRFASAFFGVLTILLTFFLAKKLFQNQESSIWLAICSSFLLAISPWHINLSRTATENTIVVFFVILGVFLFLFWIKKYNPYLLIASFLSFTITLIVYQAPRAFLPFFIPLLIIFLPTKLRDKKQIIFFAVLMLATIMLPLFLILSSKNLSLRLKTVSIFATSETQLTIDQQIREDGVADTKNTITRIFHNKWIAYSGNVLENYFRHFSYNFLFIDQGFPDRYRVSLVGLMYIFEIPFLIFGMWYLWRINKKLALFLISWIILVPIGSALTFDDVPNLQRTLIVFPALSIISGSGFFYIIATLHKKQIIGKTMLALLFLVMLFSFSFYLHQYYVHGPVYRPWYRQDGYKELVFWVNRLLPKYKKAVITNRESAPTIFFLFYAKFDPASFQKEKQKGMQDYDRINFGKYEFSQEECPVRITEEGFKIKLTGEKGIIYVNSGLCKEPASGIKTLNVIKRADNSVVFRVVTVK